MPHAGSRRGIHFLADPEFLSLIERGTRATGKSKTALVRDAVAEHVARIEAEVLAKRLEEAYLGLNDINLTLDEELSPADVPWPRRRRK